MSVVYCSYCDKRIDTDYGEDHFAPGTEDCLIQAQATKLKNMKAKRVERIDEFVICGKCGKRWLRKSGYCLLHHCYKGSTCLECRYNVRKNKTNKK